MDKRYLVFGITHHYPMGGLGDREDSFDTLQEARAYIHKEKNKEHCYSDSFEIYDRIEGREVEFE